MPSLSIFDRQSALTESQWQFLCPVTTEVTSLRRGHQNIKRQSIRNPRFEKSPHQFIHHLLRVKRRGCNPKSLSSLGYSRVVDSLDVDIVSVQKVIGYFCACFCVSNLKILVQKFPFRRQNLVKILVYRNFF